MSDVIATEEHEGYRFVDIQGGNMTAPLRMLETACVGRCTQPYRIDEYHPSYREIVEALECGDRSIIHCYHRGRV